MSWVGMLVNDQHFLHNIQRDAGTYEKCFSARNGIVASLFTPAFVARMENLRSLTAFEDDNGGTSRA
jgi:hypothetical protein